MARKPTAKRGDPRQWLKEKLGEADFAKFEKGMANAARARAKGLSKVKVADVEGQGPTCLAMCTGGCGEDQAMFSGSMSNMWSAFP